MTSWRRELWIVVAALLALGGTAAAQPLPRYAPERMMTREELRAFKLAIHQQLMAGSPEYREARGEKIAGIAVASTGALGLGVAAFSGLSALICAASMSGCSADLNAIKWAAIGGLLYTVVAASVGIPLAVVGARRQNAIVQRQMYGPPPLALTLAPLPGGLGAGLSWRF